METAKILIIEDNPVDALCLKEALEASSGTNFLISHVETLAEAKESLGNTDFHAVVLDLGLPDSQGMETFLEVKNSGPDVPIVVLSGLDDDNLAMETVVMGAQDYLCKAHWDPQIISKSLFYAIERHQILSAVEQANESKRLALEDLRENEERLRLVLSVVADGFWDWDVRSGSVNREAGWPSILGYRAGEIDPDVSAWTQLVHPKDMPGVKQVIETCLSGGPDTYKMNTG